MLLGLIKAVITVFCFFVIFIPSSFIAFLLWDDFYIEKAGEIIHRVWEQSKI